MTLSKCHTQFDFIASAHPLVYAVNFDNISSMTGIKRGKCESIMLVPVTKMAHSSSFKMTDFKFLLDGEAVGSLG